MTKLWLFPFLAGFLLVIGCHASTLNVPEVEFGKDSCDSCGMIISEARYASGYINSDGETVAFDDLGELLSSLRADALLIDRAHVNDLEKIEWIKADQAYYVKIPSMATPMGSGIVAFDSRQRAESFAKARGGKIAALREAIQTF